MSFVRIKTSGGVIEINPKQTPSTIIREVPGKGYAVNINILPGKALYLETDGKTIHETLTIAEAAQAALIDELNTAMNTGGGDGQNPDEPQAYYEKAKTIAIEEGIPFNVFKTAWEHSLTINPEDINTFDSQSHGPQGAREFYPVIDEQDIDYITIVIPEGVTRIPEGFFVSTARGNYIKSIVILPDTVEAIENGAFEVSGYTNKIILPKNLNTIGDNAFYNTMVFTADIFKTSPNLTHIGTNAFLGTNKIYETFIIPNHIRYIGEGAFLNTIFYGGVEVQGSNESNDPLVMGSEYSGPIFNKVQGTFKVGGYVEWNATHLFGPLYPGAVELLRVGQNVTYNNSAQLIPSSGPNTNSMEMHFKPGIITEGTGPLLNGIKISNHISINVKKIPNFTYYGVTFLNGLTIQEGVETIGELTFMSAVNNINLVVLPSTVNNIHGNALGLRYITGFNNDNTITTESLTNYIIKSIVPPTLTGGNQFTGPNVNIYVPDGSVEDYKAAPGWVDTYAENIKPISEYLTTKYNYII